MTPSFRSHLSFPAVLALLLALAACESNPLATPGPTSGRAVGAAAKGQTAGGTTLRGAEAPSAGAPGRIASPPRGAPQHRPQPVDAGANTLAEGS